jgi:ABC-type branched-subunit amino acid transport system ATPase component
VTEKPPILSVSKLSKRFGGVNAIDNCSFAVDRETITGIIGPNGAGKSTLFNLVGGQLRPDAGSILFDGERIEGRTPHYIARRGLSRTFQIPRELKRMTVLQNLMLVPAGQAGERVGAVFLQGRRIANEERRIEAQARVTLELVGLIDKADTEAELLSGGQKKLLELARCLMSDPKLILLDEPTAGVNPTLIRQLMETMRRVHARAITLVVIEHNMNVIMNLCGRVIVLDRGRPIADGSPDAIQKNPLVLEAYLGGAA